MTLPLLRTKFYFPRNNPYQVSRPILVEKLNHGLTGKLTLVCAPAGMGKTTLLGEWLTHLNRPVAWLSLDDGDNDPIRFWSYIITALQSLQPNLGSELLAAIQSIQSPPIKESVACLINEIAENIPPFTLVLDDYYQIEKKSIHDSLSFLIERLPQQMHLVISTRSNPPLYLSRLRGNGELTELRSADLRFSLQETDCYLDEVMRLGLSSKDIAILHERTEGWIVGLQLAALSMQGGFDKHAFVVDFTGDNRYIADYLVEEVLYLQPANIRNFLLQTSILGRLNAGLCNAVTERMDSFQVLAELEKRNLFTFPLTHNRECFRYHHLFAQLLRARLLQQQPERLPVLHQRASQWFNQAGYLDEALNHALASKDFEWISCLIEKHARPKYMRGEVSTVLGWFEGIPQEELTSRPRLCLDYAWALFMSNNRNDYEPWLQSAETVINCDERAEERNREEMMGEIACLRAFSLVEQGEDAQAAALAKQALELLPQENAFVRGTNMLLLGEALRNQGKFQEAIACYPEGIRLCLESGNELFAFSTTYDLAMLLEKRGLLRAAFETLQRAVNIAINQGKQELPAAGVLYTGLGVFSYQQNRLTEAQEHLNKGLKLCSQGGYTGQINGYILHAFLSQAQGDIKTARTAIEKCEVILEQWNEPLALILLECLKVQLWLIQRNYRRAIQWTYEISYELKNLPAYTSFLVQLTLAQVHLVIGKESANTTLLSNTLQTLDSLLACERANGMRGLELRVQLQRALILYALEDVDLAVTSLEEALLIAETEGYIRMFINEGQPMEELLRQTAARGISLGFVGKLLAAFQAEPKESGRSIDPNVSHLIDPLSEREVQVLRLLTVGLSSTEIARELFIAISTARTHIKNIYRKLNAHRRLEAIERAKELGLV